MRRPLGPLPAPRARRRVVGLAAFAWFFVYAPQRRQLAGAGRRRVPPVSRLCFLAAGTRPADRKSRALSKELAAAAASRRAPRRGVAWRGEREREGAA